MRVFVTGATGFIGSALVQDLVANGHSVVGLARNDAAVEKLQQFGVEVQRGDLADTETLAGAAQQADGVIHLGFIHDFANFANSAAVDRAALDAMIGVLAGTGKPLVFASGVLVLTGDRVLTELDRPDPTNHANIRSETQGVALAAAEQDVRISCVRLSPSVHGQGDHGFVPWLIQIAKQNGEAAYIEEGANRWPGVHRLDAATLFRLALEKGRAGAAYHGVADQGVRTRDIAEIIGRRLDLPVVSISKEQAPEKIGFLAGFWGTDCVASSDITQRELGWTPTQPGLLTDLDSAAYFPE